MVKINNDSQSFQQCSYSTLSQVTDYLDLPAVAKEFLSKRNATLPCCADEISRNPQKELFFSLMNNHHNKVHPVMYFRKQHLDPPPPPPFCDYIGQSGMTTVGGLIKSLCLLPPPPPLTPYKRKFASGSLRTVKC